MKRRSFNLCEGVAVAALSLTFACNSTGVGNPPTGTVQLAIVADDADDASNGVDAGAEPLPQSALEHAVVVLESIRWLPCAASASSTTDEGPFIVDLLSGETRPPLRNVRVPEGGLCGFDAPLGPARDVPALAGRSVFFSGVRADGVQFLLYADMRATLRVRAGNGQQWVPPVDGDPDGAQLHLLWAMRPRRWATRMDLGAAEPSSWAGGRRIVRIDVNRHPLLFALIRARLGSESAVLLDQNENGRLDLAERNEPELGTGSTSDE